MYQQKKRISMCKHILAILLCAIFSFSLIGCNQIHSEESSDSSVGVTTPEEAAIPSETAKLAEDSFEIKSDSFGLTLDEFTEVLEDSHVLDTFITYETAQYTVHRTGSGTDGALLFSSPGSEKIEVAFFLTYSGASRQADDTESAIYAQNLLCEYCDNNGIKYKALEIEQEPYLVFAVYALDTTLDNLSLSIRQFRSENEFFASEERVETFCNLMYSCRYQELMDYIEGFITEGQCPDNDVSYDLVDKLNKLIPMMENCHIKADDVEKNAKIFYKDVTEITKEVNVFPFVETNKYGSSLNITVGFKNSDWLFFDEILISSTSTETERFNVDDVFTDVIDGGTIIESVSIGSSVKNSLLNICEKAEPVVRFKNSDTEENIDHQLSKAEIEALLCLNHIRDLHAELWDSWSEWEEA